MSSKYDAQSIEAGRRLQGEAFDERLATRDSIDPHFTQLWLDYAVKGLPGRNVLDERTRFLVLIGQYVMTRNTDLLVQGHRRESPSSEDVAAP